ncbi:MAG: DUF3307 domain-containing protein [Pseudomonadota bacterium]
MIETAVALLLAHVLADFVFQTSWIVKNKRNPLVLFLHALIVLGLSAAALGGGFTLAAYVALAHLAMDSFKTYGLPDTLQSYLGDQFVHLTTILIASIAAPETFAGGAWAEVHPFALHLALFVSGAILAITAGGYAVALLMKPYLDADKSAGDEQQLPRGLPGAGMTIGQLERGLIFLLVMVGQPGGIGFLIAAKSILRFDAASKNHRAAEYVIIGTLSSFGWAAAIGWATVSLAGLLPPLEIAAAAP